MGNVDKRSPSKGRPVIDDLDDDDDFIHRVILTKPAVVAIKHARLSEKGRNKRPKHKEQKPKKPTKVNGIRTRTSPIALNETCLLLNDEQKKVVKEMGLKSIMKMTVDGIPSKLGYYVVENLDTDRMELDLEGASIRINKGMVNKILGLPLGGINLDTIDVDPRSSELIKRWAATYNKDKPRPCDVSNKIIDSRDAGELFKINFIVLFVNSMAECNPSVNCHTIFLSKIGSTDMIPKINWCRYIVESVRRSKRKWKRDTYDSLYSSLLTFVTTVALCSYDACVSVEVDRKLLPLHAWTMEKLRDRTKSGFDEGGLHKARIESVGACESMIFNNSSSM